MSAIDRLVAIAERDPDDRMARELLDVIEAAADVYRSQFDEGNPMSALGNALEAVGLGAANSQEPPS